jgi:hypothetical protein
MRPIIKAPSGVIHGVTNSGVPITPLNATSGSPGNIPSSLITSITSAPSNVAKVKSSSTPMVVVVLIVFAAFLLFDKA